MGMGSGCCGGDCGCGPCSEKNGVAGFFGLGASIPPGAAHAASPSNWMTHRMLPVTAADIARTHAVLGMHGLGQTVAASTGDILGGLETQLSTLWNDLQQTKIAGVGLGFILVGVVVAMHFKKR